MHCRTCEILIIILLGVLVIGIQVNGDSNWSMRSKRGLIRETAGLLGKTLSKGKTKLFEFRRTYRAASTLFAGARRVEKNEHGVKYVKPGGLEQARRDFARINPDGVVKEEHMGPDGKGRMESLIGRVGNDVVMMVSGDDILPGISIWAASWESQQCGFRPRPTQTGLYKHRSRLEA